MQMTAVYSCVCILSEAVASLLLHVYKYNGDGGKEKAVKHPFCFLLHDEPNLGRLNLKVIYSSGDTGKGKSRDILDKHGDANVYRVTEYKHPFDGYACQSVISFEEYRSQFMISDILNYCDIYPIQLPARYANKYMCADTIYITSNWPLEEQYRGVQVDSPDTWKAFLRRIHEVRIYHEDGTVTVYDSVDKYMNRDTEFHTMTEGEQLALPFKEEGEVHDA